MFLHANHLISDESIPFSLAVHLLIYIFSFNSTNVFLSLIYERELIGISKVLYERIIKLGVDPKNIVEFEFKFNVLKRMASGALRGKYKL